MLHVCQINNVKNTHNTYTHILQYRYSFWFHLVFSLEKKKKKKSLAAVFISSFIEFYTRQHKSHNIVFIALTSIFNPLHVAIWNGCVCVCVHIAAVEGTIFEISFGHFSSYVCCGCSEHYLFIFVTNKKKKKKIYFKTKLSIYCASMQLGNCDSNQIIYFTRWVKAQEFCWWFTILFLFERKQKRQFSTVSRSISDQLIM